jgi:hypothetical protein
MGSPTVTPLVEQLHDGGFVVSEANGHISRETVTLSGGVKVLPGTVLGQQTVGNAAVAAALGTNTGNGTFGAITVGAGAQNGVYSVELDDPTHFVVSAPNGQEVGHGVVGTVFAAGGLGFTITAGGTAFAPADSFTVTVAAGSGKYFPLNLTATDGTATAAGILCAYKDVTNADKPAVAMKRNCEVNASELIWPAGINAGQIATATAQLAATSVILR